MGTDLDVLGPVLGTALRAAVKAAVREVLQEAGILRAPAVREWVDWSADLLASESRRQVLEAVRRRELPGHQHGRVVDVLLVDLVAWRARRAELRAQRPRRQRPEAPPPEVAADFDAAADRALRAAGLEPGAGRPPANDARPRRRCA